jgi:hypothetical protein
VYLGKGPDAVAQSLLDDQKQERRCADRDAVRAERTAVADAEAVLAALAGWVRLVFRVSLFAAGFHLHRRQWRRQRGPVMSVSNESGAGESPDPAGGRKASHSDAAHLRSTLESLAARAGAGDAEALGELRAFLDEHPEVHQVVGDLSQLAQENWLDLLVGGDTLARECAKRQLADISADLKGTHPTRLESLLVDQIRVAYLASRHAEIAAAAPAGASLALAAFRVRRVESSQRRLLAAVRTLATLRAAAPQGLAPLHPLRPHGEERRRA